VDSNNQTLVKLDKASRMLAEISSVDDARKIISLAEAARVYAKQASLGLEAQNRAAEIKIRAQRRAGEILSRIESQQGKRADLPEAVTSPNGGRSSGKHQTYKEADISKGKAQRWQTIAAIPEDRFEEIITAGKEGENELTTLHVYKLAKEKERMSRVDEEKTKRIDNLSDVEIRRGDFKDVLADIYDIDAIITDPPYPKEYIKCFSELSKYASEHLKEDGFCIAYSGQYNLPEVISRMSEHLTYVWTFCLYHVGKKQLVNGVNIMCGWKPVLVFSRGRKKMRYSAYDVLISEASEKHSHEWQQSESGVAGLIEIFTEPGQLVVDPFAGSGTFPKVAHDMGRNAIGAEIE
jgi:hypothetical protein